METGAIESTEREMMGFFYQKIPHAKHRGHNEALARHLDAKLGEIKALFGDEINLAGAKGYEELAKSINGVISNTFLISEKTLLEVHELLGQGIKLHYGNTGIDPISKSVLVRARLLDTIPRLLDTKFRHLDTTEILDDLYRHLHSLAEVESTYNRSDTEDDYDIRFSRQGRIVLETYERLRPIYDELLRWHCDDELLSSWEFTPELLQNEWGPF